MHFCHEELLAILALIPVVNHLVGRLRLWFHRRHRCEHAQDAGYASEHTQNDDAQ